MSDGRSLVNNNASSERFNEASRWVSPKLPHCTEIWTELRVVQCHVHLARPSFSGSDQGMVQGGSVPDDR